jgi:3-oxoacyl-[acyl-carrier protein] reductase
MGALTGKRIFITGAGAGVGAGLAEACAAAGGHVVVTSRGPNGRQLSDTIVAGGGSAEWMSCDVSSRRSIDDAVAATIASGGLHAFIHNAVSPLSSVLVRLEELDDDQWDQHAVVSLRASYWCAVAAREALIANRGLFLLMTSPAGMEGSVGLPAYGVVKGAQRGFAKSLAREWASTGVRVNSISPLAATPAMDNLFEVDPPSRERILGKIPLGRLGDSTADIGAAAVFLASDDATYITGQTLVVDGGRFMNL